jgi:PD-(D/E)XK nuclease superfamily
MSFQWSISTDRLFRRCQRQFFFREIAASHAAKDWRREAFILKQLKTLELWRGTLIHEGIQHYVVPVLKKGAALNWDELAERNVQRAKEQLDFSAKRRYREEGMVKGEHEDFCALVPHENGKGVSKREFEEVCGEIRAVYRRLSEIPKLWEELLGRHDCHAEKQFWVSFDNVRIMVQLDLMFERSLDRPTIIDWKSYGVRAALATSSDLENPTLGTWEVFSKTEGLVCTTGWPFNIPGTVEPLVVLVARGNLDLVKILEDTFRMAQLCWPTPTGCMRLPVDLKLCDEHLRAFAGRADEDKALFGESEQEAKEPLLTAAK